MTASDNSKHINALFEAMLRMKDWKELQCSITELCTGSDLNAMAERQLIARMLQENRTGSEIVRRTGNGTDTIYRVNRGLRHGAGGHQAVLSREEKNGLVDPTP